MYRVKFTRKFVVLARYDWSAKYVFYGCHRTLRAAQLAATHNEAREGAASIYREEDTIETGDYPWYEPRVGKGTPCMYKDIKGKWVMPEEWKEEIE